MPWVDTIRHYTQTIKSIEVTWPLLQQLLSYIDLTNLKESDSEQSIIQFSRNAITDLGHVAAVCVYPHFVPLMAKQFEDSPVKVATVVNFPSGQQAEDIVLKNITLAIDQGASEIDVVMPYRAYLAGQYDAMQSLIAACKLACGQKVILKVILETGVLQDPEIIANASSDAIKAGADFLKTSTGKIPQGATFEAVIAMLTTIKQLQPTLARPVGLKVSGGVREVEEALQYVSLAKQVMGESWVTPKTFRIGASRLVDQIVHLAGLESGLDNR